MSAIALRVTIALAGLLAAMPFAHAAENACGSRAVEIVRKAYPGAKALPENMFEVDGKTLTVPEPMLTEM
mgnify:FL=1